ncbi:MAG: DUF4358 domain-containing protein [Clostridia bacterium]|nr:DUF4358 domain-containing protein [Clostridia bacterium]
MKKLTAALFAVIIAFTFFGCSKKIYDADIVADALNSGLKFGESLEKSTPEAAFSVYGIEPDLCQKAAIYLGSGATADEIAVFDCVDETACATVFEAVNERIEYLREGYSGYGPEEVPKIDSAALITLGNTVILCICENPEKAESIAVSAAK